VHSAGHIVPHGIVMSVVRRTLITWGVMVAQLYGHTYSRSLLSCLASHCACARVKHFGGASLPLNAAVAVSRAARV